jgi:hypothetical protein
MTLAWSFKPTLEASMGFGFLNAIKDGKLLWRNAVGQRCNSNDPQAP